MLTKILNLLKAIGPGIFAIGYTIGTGSVTAMIVAGSQFGMQLLWVLFLSCMFSWVLMEAYGRYYLVTGETALYSFKKRLKFCLLYTSPSPRDRQKSRMPSSA